MQRIYGLHCGRVFVSARCAVCLPGKLVSCCEYSVCVGRTWPSLCVNVLRCVSLRRACEFLWVQRVHRSHCSGVSASGYCTVCLFGRPVSCCGCSVCMGRAAAEFWHQQFGCASLWKTFECCGCGGCMGCTAAEFSHQRVALCVFLDDVELPRMQRMCGSRCGRVFASAFWLCVFLEACELPWMERVYGRTCG